MQMFKLDGQIMNSDGIVQKAFSYTMISSWLQLLHPNRSAEQVAKYDELVKLASYALYDYGSGTAIFNSGRVMSMEDSIKIIETLFGRKIGELRVKVDPLHTTVIFVCLLGLRSHQSLLGAVNMFRKHKLVGPFFIDLVDNPKLLSLDGRDVDIVKTLNTFLFQGCRIVDQTPCVPTLVTPYGSSTLWFQGTTEDDVRPFVPVGKFNIQQLVLAAEAGRKDIFRNRFNVKDVAPCEGASIYNGMLTVTKMYNKRQGPIDQKPTRGDLILVLKELFQDGKGGISDPTLLITMVLIMFSYLAKRVSWAEPIRDSTDPNGGGRVTFEEKIRLELELLGFDVNGIIDTSSDAFKVFSYGNPVTTMADFIKVFGVDTWNELVEPLSTDEKSLVFVKNKLEL